MKYVIEIPDEIDRALEQRASASGEDVVDLIQMAVVSFVGTHPPSSLAVRRPDQPLDAIETAPPCDLPRTAPRLVPIEKRASRHLDPIADSA